MSTRLDVISGVRAGETDGSRLIPYAAFALIVLAEAAAILYLNHGRLMYTLDDAYIHLALAERIGAGTYGVNLGEFAAPASSILWPFMLSLFAKTGLMQYVPYAINLLASLGTLSLMAHAVRQALGGNRPDTASTWVAVFVVLLIPATNLVPLAFTGMEHSLQQLLAVAVVVGLIHEGRTGRTSPYLWAAIILLPLVRYDSLALSVPVLGYLAWRGHWKGFTLAVGSLAVTLGLFSWFLKSHGLGFLPTSITAKAGFMNGGVVGKIAVALYENVVLSNQGLLLLLGSVLLIAASLDQRRPMQERVLPAAVAMAVLLHLVFGKVGAYFRYEAYLSAALLLMLIHVHGAWLSGAFQSGAVIAQRLAALGSLAVVSLGYVFALISTPMAANNIFLQQYQMHRFVVDYFKAPVAVNDLGWVSFQNPSYVLDFAGLGSFEAQRARLTEPAQQWMERLAREHDVGLVLIYDTWFPSHPEQWTRVGTLKLLRPRITPAASEVQFYARDATSASRALSALTSFVPTLPPGAEFIPASSP